MPVVIEHYTPEFEPAVHAFNHRLAEGGVTFQFPDHGACTSPDDSPIVRRGFVAVQDKATVRGGYLVQEQDFCINGQRARLGYLHLPLSEGLLDRRYSTLGVQLIAHALKRQPLLFGLGIGGTDEAFAKIVSSLRWTLDPVPFLFKVVRPARVARQLTAIRRTAARRLACDVAAVSGLAAIGSWALQRRSPAIVHDARAALTEVADLDAIADELWTRRRDDYRLAAWRDGAALRQRYSREQRPFLKFVLQSVNGPIGWVVALDTQKAGDKYFGNLRVGTIVDLCGEPAHAGLLVRSVTHALEARGVDLIVTNQCSNIWTRALRDAGFLTHTSNYLFAASPALKKALGAEDFDLGSFHLTRGDGDGPINL